MEDVSQDYSIAEFLDLLTALPSIESVDPKEIKERDTRSKRRLGIRAEGVYQSSIAVSVSPIVSVGLFGRFLEEF